MQWEEHQGDELQGIKSIAIDRNEMQCNVRTRSDNQRPCHVSLVLVRLQSLVSRRPRKLPRRSRLVSSRLVTHSSNRTLRSGHTLSLSVTTVLPRLCCYSLARSDGVATKALRCNRGLPTSLKSASGFNHLHPKVAQVGRCSSSRSRIPFLHRMHLLLAGREQGTITKEDGILKERKQAKKMDPQTSARTKGRPKGREASNGWRREAGLVDHRGSDAQE